MSIDKLDQSLRQSLADFSEEIRSSYQEGSSCPATENDIVQLARHTFYTLDNFREQLVSYLKEK